MAIILATRDYYAIIFTNSEVLHKAVAKLGYLLAVTMVLNSVQPVVSGMNLSPLPLSTLLWITDHPLYLILFTILKSFLQVLLLEVGGKPWWPTST